MLETTTTVKVAQDQNDFWDDDGDEIIFLASQAFEADLHSQKIINTSHMEVTYNQFSNGAQGSTQQNSDRNDIQYSELKGVELQELENADNFFLKYADQVEADYKKIEETQKTVSQILRKIESTASPEKKVNLNERKEREEANRKLANTIKTLRKDNEKLKNDQSEINEKLLTSEGEISFLRYEIKQLRHHHDQQRLDKIQEDQNQKKSFMDKIAELEKNLKIQKIELELKKLEISKVKSKNLNESQRLVNDKDQETLAECKRDLDLMKEKYFAELPQLLPKIKIKQKVKIHPDIFIELSEETRPDPQHIKLSENFKKIQSLLAQFQANQSFNFLIEISDQIFEAIKSSFIILLECTSLLRYSKFQDKYLNPKVEHEFISTQKAQIMFNGGNIFQAQPMFEKEKEITCRRIIAALAIFCGNSRELTDIFFNREFYVKDREGTDVSKSCFEIVSDILNALSFSYDLQMHLGVVTSAAHLLNNVGKLYREYNMTPPHKMFILLKHVIFCRPSINGLAEVSEFLSEVRLNDFLKKLCQKEGTHKLMETALKFVLFTADACLLQVYGSILEVAFPQNSKLSEIETELMVQITFNTFDLIRFTMQNTLEWTLEQTLECDCSNKLGVAAIVLFHLTMQQWIYDPNLIRPRVISSIVSTGIVVLSYIFNMKYKRTILHTGGYAISQRIQILHNWITEYWNCFSLSKPQRKFLKSLHYLYA